MHRIGVFGGAFDPPHAAHVAIAKAAIDQLQLDRLYIIPTGQAWHKTRTLTDAQHRLAMAQIAFVPLPTAVVDAREIQRAGPSYTIDTLIELRTEHPDAQIYLIIGADQAQSISHWYRWQELVQLAIICIASRDVPQCHFQIPAAQHLQMPLMPLSSTQIRQAIALHHPVNALVPAAVLRYIDEHHRYRPD